MGECNTILSAYTKYRRTDPTKYVYLHIKIWLPLNDFPITCCPLMKFALVDTLTRSNFLARSCWGYLSPLVIAVFDLDLDR